MTSSKHKSGKSKTGKKKHKLRLVEQSPHKPSKTFLAALDAVGRMGGKLVKH